MVIKVKFSTDDVSPLVDHLRVSATDRVDIVLGLGYEGILLVSISVVKTVHGQVFEICVTLSVPLFLTSGFSGREYPAAHSHRLCKGLVEALMGADRWLLRRINLVRRHLGGALFKWHEGVGPVSSIEEVFGLLGARRTRKLLIGSNAHLKSLAMQQVRMAVRVSHRLTIKVCMVQVLWDAWLIT